MKDNILCAIPARAGSKRLPGKNLLSLSGKPMIAYSIETAVSSGLFKDVYVCTEDPTIAQTSREYGAQVPILMPPELCEDLVPSHVPCSYMADYLRDKGEEREILVCLQPTSPLRSVEDLRAGVGEFLGGNLDFLVSVTVLDPHYFHWAVIPQEDGYWAMYFKEKYLVERSSLPNVYRPNGSIKIARIGRLLEVGHFFGPLLGTAETPEERSIHVATRFDFELCELLLGRKNS